MQHRVAMLQSCVKCLISREFNQQQWEQLQQEQQNWKAMVLDKQKICTFLYIIFISMDVVRLLHETP